MRTNTITLAAILIFTGSLLSACGGGNNGNANQDSFVQNVTKITDVTSEDTEPEDVENITVNSPEDTEPEQIS